MKGGRAYPSLVTLLLAGLLVWSTTAQAFFFCFSFGGKGRGNGHTQSRYYGAGPAWVPPPPVMPYYAFPAAEFPLRPQPPVAARSPDNEENQGLDYIMQ